MNSSGERKLGGGDGAGYTRRAEMFVVDETDGG